MARLFSFKPTLTIKGRKFKGLRGFSGKPFHPPLTDFPITCYFLAAVFDVISYIAWQQDKPSIAHDFFVSGTHVIIAGLLVSVPTALTGFWDWLKSTPKHTQVWRTANTHMAIMLTVTAIVVVDVLMRLSGWDEGYAELGVTIISVVVGSLVSLGAAFGGTMVYEYAFNVEQDIDYAYTPSEEDRLPGQKAES
ncbi:MAG: hypothetical protein QOG54_2267 [Actinomycetota bacterium]|nr:hypothetical protein [Actinomycetota bacterium]